MKLLNMKACHLAFMQGNVNKMTVMEEVLTEELSDAGSIPARSTKECRKIKCLRHPFLLYKME